jgi:hypothetical protein
MASLSSHSRNVGITQHSFNRWDIENLEWIITVVGGELSN